MEHIERAHPLRVTLGEIVVDRHHTYAAAREGAEKHGEGCHEGLALAGGHLGYLALMEHDTAYELHVVVDHVPLHLVATGAPGVAPYGLIAFDGHKVAPLGGKVAGPSARQSR